MSSTTQLSKAVTTPANNANLNPLAARSQQGNISPIKADADAEDIIDDILSCFLIYILPASFLSGIIVLGMMLISSTIVMRIPLPRLFALIIIIVFAVLITITFFFLDGVSFSSLQMSTSCSFSTSTLHPVRGMFFSHSHSHSPYPQPLTQVSAQLLIIFCLVPQFI